jgi:hypothetical protein
MDIETVSFYTKKTPIAISLTLSENQTELFVLELPKTRKKHINKRTMDSAVKNL